MGASPATWTLIGIASGLLLLASVGLWMRYGETIFVQSLLTGLAGCFG